MKTFLKDWLFYLRMFIDEFFITCVMVSICVTMGIGFLAIAMNLDIETVAAASQARLETLSYLVLIVTAAFSIGKMIVTVIEAEMDKQEEKKEKAAAQCSEKLTSPLA